VVRAEFDAAALFDAMDGRRAECGLTWRQVADQIWEQSADLNRRRTSDHPISPSTITGFAKRGDLTCQHALFFLRWLDRTPECFLTTPPPDSGATRLPAAGSDRRLRWNLDALYDALNAQRKARDLTWKQLARELRCAESQLTGIKTAKYAIGMRLAMRIVVWLERPAAAFIYGAQW
jgi:hypothetical protein